MLNELKIDELLDKVDSRYWHHFLRKCVHHCHIQIVWIKGIENLAEAFTKALGRPKFEDFIYAVRLDQEHGSMR